MNSWKGIISTNALNLLFPIQEKCAFCDRRARKKGICRLCMENILSIHGEICEQCGRELKHRTLCGDCLLRKENFFVSNRSAVHYNQKMKEVISRYKFRGDEGLAHILVHFLEDAYRQHYARTPIDYLTYVPLHEHRLKERGFNQAQQLAFQLGLRIKVPVLNLLTRIRLTQKQSKKHRTDRLSSLQGAFQFSEQAVPAKNVLLIDDVYTTGSTINECARVLAKKGMTVYSLTVAR